MNKNALPDKKTGFIAAYAEKNWTRVRSLVSQLCGCVPCCEYSDKESTEDEAGEKHPVHRFSPVQVHATGG